ncbi:MAG: methylmalonyl Co-A mutase-associated GTPase MeaB [Flavobacteriales bacterium]
MHKLSTDILTGNRSALARTITLVESTLVAHQEEAQSIIQDLLPYSGQSLRIGITGVPGVGKSTFIEALGKHLTTQGKKVAVLAIDPSSEKSGGSILGDKTRMNELSADDLAFIRPSPTAGSLGGVARRTRESIILCEAAGYEVILIETVGVGQSETVVHSMVDVFLLMMLAGAGDELQGIKRGIMEMADILLINKADGDNLLSAKKAQAQYKTALHLFPPNENGWTTPVDICSAQQKTGIAQAWQHLNDFQQWTTERGFFEKQRQEQQRYWLKHLIQEHLQSDFYQKHHAKIQNLEEDLAKGKLTPSQALDQLFK